MVTPVDASVHLHLRGRFDDEGLAGLRQQLARCLASGVSDIVVHAETQPDLGLPALRTLYGAAAYLAASGGSLRLVGAQAPVLARLRVYELDDLLPGIAVRMEATPAAALPAKARRSSAPTQTARPEVVVVERADG